MADVKKSLAAQAQAVSQAPAQRATVLDLIKSDSVKFDLTQILPEHISAEAFIAAVLLEFRKNPLLLQCIPNSVHRAVLEAARNGLMPGGITPQVYFVPFRNTEKNVYECQAIVSVYGLQDMAYRSGAVAFIDAYEVYSNDYIEVVLGLEEKFQHIPWYARKDGKFNGPGEFMGAYMIAHMKDGRKFGRFVHVSEIERHRQSSRAKDSGPWKTHYIEMARKTAIRIGIRRLPLSPDVRKRMLADEEPEALPTEMEITIPQENMADTEVAGETIEEPITNQEHQKAEAQPNASATMQLWPTQ